MLPNINTLNKPSFVEIYNSAVKNIVEYFTDSANSKFLDKKFMPTKLEGSEQTILFLTPAFITAKEYEEQKNNKDTRGYNYIGVESPINQRCSIFHYVLPEHITKEEAKLMNKMINFTFAPQTLRKLERSSAVKIQDNIFKIYEQEKKIIIGLKNASFEHNWSFEPLQVELMNSYLDFLYKTLVEKAIENKVTLPIFNDINRNLKPQTSILKIPPNKINNQINNKTPNPNNINKTSKQVIFSNIEALNVMNNGEIISRTTFSCEDREKEKEEQNNRKNIQEEDEQNMEIARILEEISELDPSKRKSATNKKSQKLSEESKNTLNVYRILLGDKKWEEVDPVRSFIEKFQEKTEDKVR